MRKKSEKAGEARAVRDALAGNRRGSTSVIGHLASEPGMCPLCGKTWNVSPGVEICTRCRREIEPTALSLIVDVVGVEDLATWAGVSTRAVRRALAGKRLSPKSAAALAKLTGLPVETFRPPRAKGPAT